VGKRLLYFVLSLSILLTGCENSNNEEPEQAPEAWRLVATNDSPIRTDIGLENTQLYKFAYSESGELERSWRYSVESIEYSDDLMRDEEVFEAYIGGGVFHRLPEFLRVDQWSLSLAPDANYVIHPDGDNILAVSGVLNTYHPLFGPIAGGFSNLFESAIPLKIDPSVTAAIIDLYTIKQPVDETIAKPLLKGDLSAEVNENVVYARQWSDHYSDYTFNEASGVAVINLYSCLRPPSTRPAGTEAGEFETDDLWGLSNRTLNELYAIKDLPDYPCKTFELHYSQRGVLDSVIKHYQEHNVESFMTIEYLYTYQRRDDLLEVNVEKLTTRYGTTVSYTQSWAVYEAKSCSQDFFKEQSRSVPEPFLYCIWY